MPAREGMTAAEEAKTAAQRPIDCPRRRSRPYRWAQHRAWIEQRPAVKVC
jgi:hypothetical protein